MITYLNQISKEFGIEGNFPNKNNTVVLDLQSHNKNDKIFVSSYFYLS